MVSGSGSGSSSSSVSSRISNIGKAAVVAAEGIAV